MGETVSRLRQQRALAAKRALRSDHTRLGIVFAGSATQNTMIRDPCRCLCLTGLQPGNSSCLQLMAQGLQHNPHEASGRCVPEPSLPVKHAR